MPQVAKVGDIGHGTCNSHTTPTDYTTTFISGASTVFVNGAPMAIVGTVGDATCGHPTTALVGDPTVFAEGSPTHRVGDIGENGGKYTTLSGSSNVFAS